MQARSFAGLAYRWPRSCDLATHPLLDAESIYPMPRLTENVIFLHFAEEFKSSLF